MTLEILFALIAMIQSVTLELQYDVPVPSFCDSMGCANNSTCRTTLTNNEMEGSHVTYSECLCYGHWIGQKCDHHLSLRLLHHQETVAMLQTDVKYHVTSQEAPRDASQMFDLGDLNFNVQYWSNERGAMCSIMTQVKNKHFQLNGLNDGEEYAVCVSAVGVDLCFSEGHREFNLQTNCVLFRTLSRNQTIPTAIESGEGNTTSVAAPVSLSVFFLIVIILFILTVVKCRKERYYEDIVPTLRYWMYSFRHKNCPCFSNEPTPQTIVPSHHGCMFPRSGNSRYRNYSQTGSGNLHPTGMPLTTIIEYTNEEAETSASPLMDSSQVNATEGTT